MDIIYNIGQILENNNFIVNIDVVDITEQQNYRMVTEIDLVKNYSDYHFINNCRSDNIWYLVVKKKFKETDKNKQYIRGDIIEYNIQNIESTNIKYIIKDNLLLRTSNQSEYDKYCYCLDKKNSNSRLYKLIYELVNENNKNNYYEYLDRMIKEPLLKKENKYTNNDIDKNNSKVLII